MHVSYFTRWVLCVLAVVLALPACQSRDEANAVPAAAEDSVVADSTVEAAPEEADSIRGMTDGGDVQMPAVQRRVLVREDPLWEEALRIHYNALVIDGHVDTPALMVDEGYRLGVRHRSAEGHLDLPRMFEGGLDAAFFSIYVAPYYGEGARATERARSLIAELERQIAASSDSVALATSAEDVRQIARSGRKAALIGIEGGHALAADPALLAEFYESGVRYVTLTHINTNAWADASQAAPRWGGLNELGREIVREMNRLGILVDLSHVSDSTFYDALAASRAPVILSHSSARALVESVRNVDDRMLRALAENGGVVMINFFDAVVNPHLTPEVMAEVRRRLPGSDLRQLWNVVYTVKREQGLPGASLEDVLDHIDHVVAVAGIDHVALGSDFDGVFDLPAGLQDVTRLPWLTYGLLERGYTEEEIYKILGGNTLRVLEEAEHAAAAFRHENPAAE